MHKPAVGLVLSGGGARGIAHIGVLRVLEREGIPIDYLAGTSMGGVIAAGFAAGMSSKELEQIATSTTQRNGMLRLADPGLPNGGVIRGERLLAFFKHEFGEKTFSELCHPLALVAVDLNSHKEIVFREGSVALALRATTSIPGVFMPLELNGWRLVDGGVLNNLPVDVAIEMGSEKVIAVDIGLSSQVKLGDWLDNKRWVPASLSNTFSTFEETIYALRIVEQENKLRQYPPDLLIKPELPREINSFAGYSRIEELILAGEKATEAQLEKIAERLKF